MDDSLGMTIDRLVEESKKFSGVSRREYAGSMKSRLKRYAPRLLDAKRNGATDKFMIEFLARNGIVINPNTFSNYMVMFRREDPNYSKPAKLAKKTKPAKKSSKVTELTSPAKIEAAPAPEVTKPVVVETENPTASKVTPNLARLLRGTITDDDDDDRNKEPEFKLNVRPNISKQA